MVISITQPSYLFRDFPQNDNLGLKLKILKFHEISLCKAMLYHADKSDTAKTLLKVSRS